MTLHVLHPDDRRLQEFRGLPWVYADEKQAVYSLVEKVLGADFRFVVPREFQSHALLVHADFVAWADLNVSLEDKDDWILTPLHRNPFVNNIQLHLVWLLLIAARQIRQDLVIVTDSLGLVKTLESNEQNFGIVRYSTSSRALLWLAQIWKNTRALIRLARDAVRFLYSKALSHLYLGKKAIERCRLAEVVFERYIQRNNILPDDRYADTNTEGLIEWYAERNIRCALLVREIGVSPANLPRFISSMRNCAIPIVPYERLVSLANWIEGISTVTKAALRSRSTTSSWMGIDVSPLVTASRIEASLSNLSGFLYKFIPKRMESLGIRPRMILDWFENQPLDRAMALGMQDALSGTRLVGLRQYTIFPLCSYLYVSLRAAIARMAPELCLVSGKAMARQLGRLDGHTRIVPVPALRYKHVYSGQVRATENSTPVLLVLLTHSDEESQGILQCLLPALHGLRDTWCGKLVLKCHPTINVADQARKVESNWPWIRELEGLEWSSQNVQHELERASLVISAGSSAVLEAVCQGVPAVIVGRLAGLNMNPVEDADRRMWAVVYDSNEMSGVLARWWPTHPLTQDVRRELARDLLHETFESITIEGMSAFSADDRSCSA